VFENHVGINITSSKIQLVEIIFDSGRFYLNNIDEEYFSEFIDFNDKETKLLSVIQSSFDDMMLRRQIKSRFVSFTIPHDQFLFAQLPYDKTLVASDLTEHFKWELSVLYPNERPEELALQHIEINKNKIALFDAVILIALKKRIIKLLNQFCINNKLKLKYVDNAHLAADVSSLLSGKVCETALTLSACISENFLSVEYMLGSDPIRFKVYPLNHAGEIIPILKDELRSKIDFNIQPRMISRAVVLGDNITDSFIEQSRSQLNIQFKKINPFDKIAINEEIAESGYLLNKSFSFSSAAGIAYRLV
jgi:Tfp pilus assembly PilM family ATPase